MSTCCSEVVKVGEANNFESVRGEPYSVTVDQLPRVAGKNGGLSVEFRSCVRTKTRRASLVLATLGFLDLAVSFLLVEFNMLVVQCVFLMILFLYILFSLVLSTYKEVVHTIQGLGVQISSTNWLGYTSSVFLPHTIISDIVINEGITMCRVVFYLAVVVVRDKSNPHPHIERLYPLFTVFHPRLSVLQDVYHLLRKTLHPPTTPPTIPNDHTH